MRGEEYSMSAIIEVFNPDTFGKVMAMASAFVGTTENPNPMIPKAYQGQPHSFVVALEIANRIGSSVLQVMQSLDVIQGKPGFSSQYIIGAINASGKFPGGLQFELSARDEKPIKVKVIVAEWKENNQGKKYKEENEKEIEIYDQTCYAFAVDKTGKTIKGPEVSIIMAAKEGWYGKNGSKWQTMPELMLRYRAAAFFGRLNVPEILLGMKTVEEIVDIGDQDDTSVFHVKPTTLSHSYAQLENSVKGLGLTLSYDDGKAYIAGGNAYNCAKTLTELGFKVANKKWFCECVDDRNIVDATATQVESNNKVKEDDYKQDTIQDGESELASLFPEDKMLKLKRLGLSVDAKESGSMVYYQAVGSIADDMHEKLAEIGFQNKGVKGWILALKKEPTQGSLID